MGATAAVRWTGRGMTFEVLEGPRPGSVIDGAGIEGPSPMDGVLLALAGCTGMDVISICEKKRQPVERYVVRASGERREAHPRTYVAILVEHEIEGSGVDVEAVRRSIELSARRYCPVGTHLAQGDARIAHRLVVMNAGGEHRLEALVTGPKGQGLDPLPLPDAPPTTAPRG